MAKHIVVKSGTRYLIVNKQSGAIVGHSKIKRKAIIGAKKRSK